MEKIKNKNDLPEWFNLDNYKIFHTLGVDGLESQLVKRRFLINSILEGWGWEHEQIEYWKQIQNKDVLLEEIEDPEWLEHVDRLKDCGEYLDHNRETCNLSSTGAIGGVSTMQAYMHYLALKNDGLITEEDKHSIFKNELLLGDLSMIDQLYDSKRCREGAAIFINLEEFTNKELINDFQILLPKWRSQLNIEEPEDVILAKQTDIQKVLSYEIIPLLDLKIWCEMSNKEIAHSVYAGTLFPDLNRGETEFKQTILPFFNKITSLRYRELN